jgi:hypothetical protein
MKCDEKGWPQMGHWGQGIKKLEPDGRVLLTHEAAVLFSGERQQYGEGDHLCGI